MSTATMIVRLKYSNWDEFKRFLDRANADRKEFSGAGHTLAPKVLKSISENAALGD